MTPQQKQRLKFLAVSGLSVSLGLGLLLFSLQENMMYFYTPSDIKKSNQTTNIINAQKKIRLGGLVKKGSFHQEVNSLNMVFEICDDHQSIKVSYQGVLPDLFREGQGVVVEGFLREGGFHATMVLAKHDENYRPPKVSKGFSKELKK